MYETKVLLISIDQYKLADATHTQKKAITIFHFKIYYIQCLCPFNLIIFFCNYFPMSVYYNTALMIRIRIFSTYSFNMKIKRKNLTILI